MLNTDGPLRHSAGWKTHLQSMKLRACSRKSSDSCMLHKHRRGDYIMHAAHTPPFPRPWEGEPIGCVPERGKCLRGADRRRARGARWVPAGGCNLGRTRARRWLVSEQGRRWRWRGCRWLCHYGSRWGRLGSYHRGAIWGRHAPGRAWPCDCVRRLGQPRRTRPPGRAAARQKLSARAWPQWMRQTGRRQ
jgi:hypothetical protein